MRLIDADELKFFVANYYNDSERLCVLDVVEKMPTVEAEPVRHGRWITWKDKFPGKVPKKKNNLGVFCSECKLHADNKSAFCSNCGAKMDQEDNP